MTSQNQRVSSFLHGKQVCQVWCTLIWHKYDFYPRNSDKEIDGIMHSTLLGHKWVPKTADIIFDFSICLVHLSHLISCYYLISSVLYPNQSYKLYNWIWDIILENPERVNLCLQVSMVQNERHLTPEEKIMIFQFSEQGYHGQNFPK